MTNRRTSIISEHCLSPGTLNVASKTEGIAQILTREGIGTCQNNVLSPRKPIGTNMIIKRQFPPLSKMYHVFPIT